MKNLVKVLFMSICYLVFIVNLPAFVLVMFKLGLPGLSYDLAECAIIAGIMVVYVFPASYLFVGKFKTDNFYGYLFFFFAFCGAIAYIFPYLQYKLEFSQFISDVLNSNIGSIPEISSGLSKLLNIVNLFDKYYKDMLDLEGYIFYILNSFIFFITTVVLYENEKDRKYKSDSMK